MYICIYIYPSRVVDLFGQIFLYFHFIVPQHSSFKANKQLIVMKMFYSILILLNKLEFTDVEVANGGYSPSR